MKIYRIEPKSHLKLRIIATMIDYIIYCTFIAIFVYCFGQEREDGKHIVTNAATLPVLLIWFIYFVVTEAINQATPGHDIFKLKVYKFDGSKPSWSDCFKRRICDALDIIPYGLPALICISKTDKHQRIGDLLANTIVAKKEDIIETEVHFNE